MQKGYIFKRFFQQKQDIFVFSKKHFLFFQLLFLTTLLYRIFFRNIYPSPPFVYDLNDTFMDFFNTCYWTFQREDTYTSWQSVYPPFAHLLCVISYIFIIPDLGEIAPGNGFNWRYNALFMLPFWIMVGIYFLSIFSIIMSRCSHLFDFKTNFLIFLSISFSIPSLFMIERGNILMYAIAFVNFTFALREKYLFNTVNYLRVILISLSTSIKPYLLLLIFPLKKIEYFLIFLITFFLANFLALLIWQPKSPENLLGNLGNFTSLNNTSFLVERSFYSFGISTYSLVIDLAGRFLFGPTKFLAVAGLLITFGICLGLVAYNSYLFWKIYQKVSPLVSNTFSFFLGYTFCIYLMMSLLREAGGYAMTFFLCSLIVFISYFPKAKFNLLEFSTTAYLFFYIPFLPEHYYRFINMQSFLGSVLNIPLKILTPTFMLDPLFRPLVLQLFFYAFLQKIWSEVSPALVEAEHKTKILSHKK